MRCSEPGGGVVKDARHLVVIKDARHLVVVRADFLTTFRPHEAFPIP
jgi:hypothetical protein